MMSPAAMAIATLTVMLWLMWSDTIRGHRPAPILYAVRVALYIIVSGLLVLNLVRHAAIYDPTARVLTVAAALVGLLGAGYFARRLVLRR